MYRFLTLTFLFALICSCFTACSGEGNSGEQKPPEAKILEVSQDKIVGKWEITEAYRNGRKTDALEGAYFQFESSGKVTSNLTGEVQEDFYKVENNQIVQSGSLSLVYKVKSLDAQNMLLELSMQGFDFEFTLKRT